jgi:hypothetical protein
MSFKLQDRIQSIKGMPGKYKRILLAIARRAKNDGTNMYASKKDLADLAGVSKWTVFRNLDDLIGAGIVVEASEHTCSNKNCDKKNYHFCGNGHYTVPYNLDVATLQNATQLLKEQGSKMPKVQGSKMPKTKVAKCDAKQGLYKPASLGSQDEASALTSGNEIKKQEPAAQIIPEAKKEQPKFVADRDQTKLALFWERNTGTQFKYDEVTGGDYALVKALIEKHGFDEVEEVLDNTLTKRPKSAGMVWDDFTVFARNYEYNLKLYLAYRRTKSAKAVAAGKPEYRAESGRRTILTSDL